MTRSLFVLAWRRIRARPGRAGLTSAGVFAVAAMIGAATTVSYSLTTGFDRAANRAGMPDVTASFDPASLSLVQQRAGTLPDVASLSYRLVQSGVTARALTTNGRFPAQHDYTSNHAIVAGLFMNQRRGYTIVAGHDLSANTPMAAVIERGAAQAWHLGLGDLIDLRGSGHPTGPDAFRIVGIAVSPDTVAYPLAVGPRVYVPYASARRLWFSYLRSPVNQVLLWARTTRTLPLALEQARAASFGLRGFQFVTRSGLRTLVDGAAGIVIQLLIAFSVIALVSATLMLSAAAYSDTRRNLATLGVIQAIGATRRQLVLVAVFEALILSVPAALVGVTAGWALTAEPSQALLAALNEFPPGLDLAAILAAAGVVCCLLPALAAAWPALLASRRLPAHQLGDGDYHRVTHRHRLPAGPLGLGIRMALGRPLRTAATIAVAAAAAAVVLLMLALASLLTRLQTDPGTLGERYALSVSAPPWAANQIAGLPGVAAAAPRYTTTAVDSFNLGETFQLIAYPGNPTRFEHPPLVAGRAAPARGQAVVGQGLANALGLRPGATIAAQLATGRELRFHVAGIVATLLNDGQVAYIQPSQLLAADTHPTTAISVAVGSGASQQTVTAAIARLGFATAPAGTATTHQAGFLGVLATLLRTIALIDAAVCLYAVTQMLALSALERQSAVATLRAFGATPIQLVAVFLGSAAVVALIAAPLALVAEQRLLGPQTANLAANYAQITLTPTPQQLVQVGAGLAAIAVTAAVYITHRTLRLPAAHGLRND